MLNPKFAVRSFFFHADRRDRLWVQAVWEAVKAGALMAGAIALVAPEAVAAALTDWRYDAMANQLEVVVAAGTTPKYFLMAQPARIVVDLPDTEMGGVKVKESYAGAVTQVRVSQFQPRVTRIVLELSPEIALTPDQVKLERVASAAGDRWVLRPLIVGGGAVPIPMGMPAAPPAAPLPSAIADSPPEALPQELLPVEQEPKRLNSPAVQVPALPGDNATTEASPAHLQQRPPVISPVEEVPGVIAELPPPPAPQPETAPRPRGSVPAGNLPRSPQAPVPTPVPATPEPSVLVVPPKSVVALPAVGSDVSPVTTEPLPSEILPPSVPPKPAAIAQLPPTQTTPLPPVDDGGSATAVEPSRAIQITVPPPLTLPSQGATTQVVVPTTSVPRAAEAPGVTVVPTQTPAIAPRVAPQRGAPSSLDIPSTVVPVQSLVTTPIQVPPPAAIGNGEAVSPSQAAPVPLVMPPLSTTEPISTGPQLPASSVLQSPSSALSLPAIPLADTTPAIANPTVPPPSSVIQPPVSSVMQGRGSVESGLQPPSSSVIQGQGSAFTLTAPAIATPLPAPVAEGLPVPPSSVMQGNLGQMPLAGPTADRMPPPASSVMQGNPDRVVAPSVEPVMQPPISSVMQPSVLQNGVMQPGPALPTAIAPPMTNGLQLPAPSQSSAMLPGPSVSLAPPITAVLPPIAPEQPAVVSVPPLELPGIPAASQAPGSGNTATTTGTGAIAPVAPPAAPAVEFGQPLPKAGAAALQTVPRAVPNVAASPSWGQTYYQSPRPGVILPAGATIRLAYPGATALALPVGQPRQEVLVLQTEVRDGMGTVVFPRGSYVTGQFVGNRFMTRTIAVGDRAIPFAAESVVLPPGAVSPGQIIPIQMMQNLP